MRTCTATAGSIRSSSCADERAGAREQRLRVGPQSALERPLARVERLLQPLDALDVVAQLERDHAEPAQGARAAGERVRTQEQRARLGEVARFVLGDRLVDERAILRLGVCLRGGCAGRGGGDHQRAVAMRSPPSRIRRFDFVFTRLPTTRAQLGLSRQPAPAGSLSKLDGASRRTVRLAVAGCAGGRPNAITALMTATSAPEPGTILGGKFRMVRLIGQGGMGAVLEAENTLTGKRVAHQVDEPARVERRAGRSLPARGAGGVARAPPERRRCLRLRAGGRRVFLCDGAARGRAAQRACSSAAACRCTSS